VKKSKNLNQEILMSAIAHPSIYSKSIVIFWG